jgi:hypothetical protein
LAYGEVCTWPVIRINLQFNYLHFALLFRNSLFI